MLVEDLDAEAREEFDKNLYTPPEIRDALKRLNRMGGV